MKIVKSSFKPYLKKKTRDESENHSLCIAYSVYIGSEPVSRIECTGHLEDELYEVVAFYTYDNYNGLGIGKYLMETAEKEASRLGAKRMIVCPIRMADPLYAKITDEELITIYEHLGFSWDEDKKYMEKLI